MSQKLGYLLKKLGSGSLSKIFLRYSLLIFIFFKDAFSSKYCIYDHFSIINTLFVTISYRYLDIVYVYNLSHRQNIYVI